VQQQVKTPAPAPVAPAAKMYKVGDTGPAGGIVFYDKGNFSDGWRYLEAASVGAEKQLAWCAGNRVMVRDTSADLGSGKRNTKLIVNVFTENGLVGAATQCEDMIYNGFDDWFLPSTSELALMYRVLKGNNLGSFKSGWYWSSTFSSYGESYCINFSDGSRDDEREDSKLNVRPIRAF
jgi:hypothetical protein